MENTIRSEIELINPLGISSVEPTPLASRLDTLEGKTVCQIWNDTFSGDISFKIIEQMLKLRFHSINIIPFSEFPAASISAFFLERKAETLQAIRNALVQYKCDAVISGNGG